MKIWMAGFSFDCLVDIKVLTKNLDSLEVGGKNTNYQAQEEG
jgi:hypothetical protein